MRAIPIGYDVRLGPDVALNAPGPPRRLVPLPEGEGRPIVSIDPMQWPRLFATAGRPLRRGQIAQPSGHVHLDLFGLWDDLDAMAANAPPSPLGDVGIAVALMADEAAGIDPLRDEWARAVAGTPLAPPSFDPAWPTLGYDVANSAYLSALSGFAESDATPAFAHLAAGMTANRLLREPGAGAEALALAERELSQDGPFFLFEIRRLWVRRFVDGKLDVSSSL